MILDDIQKYEHFSAQEKAIRDVLINQPQIIVNSYATDIATASYTSKSTVIRFCQKLGFKGYQDFKIKFIQDLPMLERSAGLLNKENLLNSYPIDKTLPLTLNVYDYALKETNKNLDPKVLNRIINKMKHTRYIYLYGTGENYLILEAFALRMQAFGFHIFVYNDIYTYNEMYNHIDANEIIAFIVSFTGTNNAMIECAKYLKQKGIYTVALTAVYPSPLEQICHDTLNTYLSSLHYHLNLLTRNISLQYILDTLYAHFYIEALKKNPDLESIITNIQTTSGPLY